jgi:DNA ligase-1
VAWYSPFLLAAWDPEAEAFQCVCRCMSGFTDEFYRAATERLGKTVLPGGRKPYYHSGEHPSVWFEPTEVRPSITMAEGAQLCVYCEFGTWSVA